MGLWFNGNARINCRIAIDAIRRIAEIEEVDFISTRLSSSTNGEFVDSTVNYLPNKSLEDQAFQIVSAGYKQYRSTFYKIIMALREKE